MLPPLMMATVDPTARAAPDKTAATDTTPLGSATRRDLRTTSRRASRISSSVTVTTSSTYSWM